MEKLWNGIQYQAKKNKNNKRSHFIKKIIIIMIIKDHHITKTRFNKIEITTDQTDKDKKIQVLKNNNNDEVIELNIKIINKKYP